MRPFEELSGKEAEVLLKLFSSQIPKVAESDNHLLDTLVSEGYIRYKMPEAKRKFLFTAQGKEAVREFYSSKGRHIISEIQSHPNHLDAFNSVKEKLNIDKPEIFNHFL